MIKSEFFDIVKMDDIRVSIPHTSHFTIGTSPYYAHQHGLGIDIYHNLSLENYDALSPFSGKVLKIKRLSAPKPKFLNGVDIDYLLLIRNPSNSEILYKIMHIEPCVQEGEQVEIGDFLGKTIRNGYFAYWSSPHLHLEIRPFKDAIRARGGKSFSLVIKNRKVIKDDCSKLHLEQISVQIHSISPEFILVYFPEYLYFKIVPIYGVKVRINQMNCILDGGIPHYKTGTVLFQHQSNPDMYNSIYLGNYKIGTINELRGQFGFFKFDSIKFMLNYKEVRGISLYLARFLPLLKIIPYKKNDFSFSSKSIQYLTISNS